MGKTAKKTNRKIKRTVRRTIGALLMVSAITVAAIPIPDLQAGPGAGTGKAKYTYNYNEGDTSTVSSALTGGVNLNNKTATQYTAYATRKTSTSDQFMIYDIFDFYIGNFSPTSAAVVAKYNSTFATEEVTLSDVVNYSYFTVDFDVYDSYYATGAGATTEYTYDKDDARNVAMFEKYFSNSLNTYKNRYSEWQADYNQWLLDKQAYETEHGEGTYTIPAPVEPEVLKVHPNDMPVDSNVSDIRKRWYCDKVIGWDGCDGVLVDVIDNRSIATPVGGVGDPHIYLVQATTKPEGKLLDENNFVVDQQTSVLAVGNGAFAGVENVHVLNLPKEIKYIGDDAFKGSFLKDVHLYGAETIGNRAFSGSTQLTNIIMDNASYIGKEAFYNCSALEGIVFPYQTGTIGDGAFAECINLNRLDLSNISTGNNGGGTIGEGAFYDCGLSDIKVGTTSIWSIGDGAFACTNYGIDNMTSIDMSGASTMSSLGDKLFTGRSKLSKVVMPSGYGRSSTASVLDSDTFAGCTGLSLLEFPDASRNVSYEDSTIFDEVEKEDFYVKGPEVGLTGGATKATEREATWDTYNKYSVPVPYCYIVNEGTANEKVYYEICQESSGTKYIETIVKNSDGTGTLHNCEFRGSASDIDLHVPAKVGSVPLTGLETGCFGSKSLPDSVLNHIENLDFEGNVKAIGDSVFQGAPKLESVDLGDDVATIGNSSFADCPSLEKVYIGKGVTSIGSGAFQNCNSLVDITFDTPDVGLDNFTVDSIGAGAFSTGSDKLTIHGDIGLYYGPFQWSMQKDNYVDPSTGVRVRYMSNDGLTVILDNVNNLATLVDYPHYEQLTEEERGIIPSSIKDKINLETPLTPEELRIIKRVNCSNDIKNAILGAGDSSGLDATQKATFNSSNLALTPAQENKQYLIEHMIVPMGVESIDTAGYFENSSRNTGAETGKKNTASIAAYFNDSGEYSSPDATYRNQGLFNGYYGSDIASIGNNSGYNDHNVDISKQLREYDEGNRLENKARGNDRLRDITMYNVKYLPDKCFDSCENLEWVKVGADMEDMGKLPFYNCTSLNSFACGNSKFEAINGLLYENTATGGKELIECFAGRGSVVGVSSIGVRNDPELADLTYIAPSAFEDCDSITTVDFTGCDNLTSIPTSCFKDSEMVTEIDLPESVKSIGDEAFAGTGSYTKVIVRGHEVSAGSNMFGATADNDAVRQAYVQSYKGASIISAAEKQGAKRFDPDLLEGYTVKYYYVDENMNMILIGTEDVVAGGDAKGPDDDKIPERAGYTFTGWNRSLKNITEDTTILAVYTPTGGTPGVTPGPNPTGTPGPNPTGTPKPTSAPKPSGGANNPSPSAAVSPKPSVSVSPSGTGTKYNLQVVYGSGSGQYAKDTTVIIEAIDAPAGKVFDKWVLSGAAATIYSATSKATTIKMAAGDTIVTATYKDAGSSTSRPSSTGGTGTTNRNGGTGTTSPAGGGSTGTNGTRVDILKPGISNTDKAYASVAGSTDSFVVKITENSDAANQVATALANKYGDMTPIKYFAMDISLYDVTGQNLITDTSNLSVNVTMPIPDALVQYAGNNKVGAVINGSQLEDLACKFTTIDGIPCVSFTATHFSPYTIYVDTNNLTAGTVDATPKTGDPIHPKWFVVIALAASSLFLFLKKDRIVVPKSA